MPPPPTTRKSPRMARLPHPPARLAVCAETAARPCRVRAETANSPRARRASPTPAVRARGCAPPESPAPPLQAAVRAASRSPFAPPAPPSARAANSPRARRASPTPAVPFLPLPVPQRARARCSSGSSRHPPSAPLSHPGSPSDSRPDAPRQASWEDHVDDQGLGGATPSATTSVPALQSPSLPTHCFGPAEWPTPPVLPPTAGGEGGTRLCWLCGNASQQVKSTYAPLRARTPGPGNRNFGAPVAEKVCTLE